MKAIVLLAAVVIAALSIKALEGSGVARFVLGLLFAGAIVAVTVH